MGTDVRIEKDVLFGRVEHLFLAQGGHFSLDYATGAREISGDAIKRFSSNILRRAEYAKHRSISYAHVIFPDKQSVVTEEYITDSPICLGEEHLRASPHLHDHVCYPRELLKNAGNASFLRTDTHMSDYGTVVAVSSIVQSLVNEDQAESKKHLLGLITQEIDHIGDLGRKLTPEIGSREKFIRLFFDGFRTHNNYKGRNNGIVDIRISRKALYDKRVLFFGDSFGREAAKILSYYFKEVTFLRTPFFHPEICDMVAPDILITQNVERYLHVCADDETRPSFFMYPHFVEMPYQPSVEFAKAFSAILSYPREPYQSLMRDVLDRKGKLS